MKKEFLMKVTIFATLALAVTLFTTPVWAAKTLRITLQLPIKHHLGANLIDFKEQVERESGGSLEVKIYPSAQLYKDKEVPQAVSSGAIEMGVASLSQFAGTIPAVDLFYVPFLLPSYDKVVKATQHDSPIRSRIDAEILKTGARTLWWQAYGGVVLLSKDKAIRMPEDLKGLKVRVFGKMLGEFVKALGAAPTVMSGSKQFLAYQRGTVDAGMTGITAVKPRKLDQVMDYATITNHADIEFLVLINDKVWQGLSTKEQQVLVTAARKVEKELRNKIQSLEADALEYAKTHMKVTELGPAEIAAWQKATQSVENIYIQNSGPLGAELIKAAKAL